MNRLALVRDNLGNETRYTYDAAGNRTRLTYPDGKVITYTYDAGNRLDTVTDWNGGLYDYTYDDADRLTGFSFPNGVESAYTYDAAGRLVTLAHTAGSQTLARYDYSLDAVGNRVAVTETLVAPLNPPAGAPPDSVTATFTYDGDGDRVAQTINGVETQLALDRVGLPEVIATSNGDRYLHLPGLIVQQQSGKGVEYLLADGLGSVRQVVDNDGVVVVINEYDPYGEPLQGGGSPYGYAGEWWQYEINLLYLRARYYDPGTGRLVTLDTWIGDPFDPYSLPPSYLYAGGNPTNRVDPGGH